jgi:hypothetical protein
MASKSLLTGALANWTARRVAEPFSDDRADQAQRRSEPQRNENLRQRRRKLKPQQKLAIGSAKAAHQGDLPTILRSRDRRNIIYSWVGGVRGIADALEASGRAREVVWIAHELTLHTRWFLVRGTLDAIINQDPGHEARSAARTLLAHCSGEPISPDQERIRIDIFLRDNLP